MAWKQIFYSVKMRDDQLRANEPGTSKTKQKTYPSGRVCSEEGCNTILSVYNPEEFCSLHENSDTAG